MNKFALFFVTAVADVFLYLVEGYVLSNLWGWFVSPLFGVPSFGTLQAVGIVILVRLLTYNAPTQPVEDGRLAEAFITSFFAELFVALASMVGGSILNGILH